MWPQAVVFILALTSLAHSHDEECRLSNLGRKWKYPACSCQEIVEMKPDPISGHYWIKSNENDQPALVFCDFHKESTCGGKTWARVLHYDVSNPQQHCPPNDFKVVTQYYGQRLCGRNSGGGCRSVHSTVTGYAYSRVCGSIVGYAYGSPDGFRCPGCSLDGNYVDGFSITYGTPRRHLWSFAMDYITTPYCDPNNFVGPNNFCETSTNHSEPLFSGKQFCVELPEPTTEGLELRVCGDEGLGNEDVFLQFAELYVQ